MHRAIQIKKRVKAFSMASREPADCVQAATELVQCCADAQDGGRRYSKTTLVADVNRNDGDQGRAFGPYRQDMTSIDDRLVDPAEGFGIQRYRIVSNAWFFCRSTTAVPQGIGWTRMDEEQRASSGESQRSSAAFFGKNKAQRQHSKTNAAGLQQQHLHVHVCSCCVVCLLCAMNPAFVCS